MSQDHDFTFELGPLPAEDTVSLADAMQFLRYGGIPRFRPASSDQPAAHYDGSLYQDQDGHYRFYPAGSATAASSPHVLDVAKAGAVFSFPRDGAERASDWRAEVVKREAELQSLLNEAARSGKLKMFGTRVSGPMHLEPSPKRPKAPPEPIDREYFHITRDFDDAYCRIHYVDCDDYLEMEQELITAAADDEPVYSFSNVKVERAGVVALMAEMAPEVAWEQPADQRAEVEGEPLAGEHAAAPEGIEATEIVDTADVVDPSVPSTRRPAGRPGARATVRAEMERRAAAHEMITSRLIDEAEHLSRWLEEKFPNEPNMRMKAKSISDIFGGHADGTKDRGLYFELCDKSAGLIAR
ncbi:hypothetical protein [Xanthobacter sp. KR7-225]|uniref:hypothetical protein n=1 Tax=Xanthobacter sp. KR7-225 TaxID=3156613 RepID=UPI0032B3E20D